MTHAAAGWLPQEPLQHARAGQDVAIVEPDIFVFGGFDADDALSFVESRRRQGPQTWRDRKPMPTARSNVAAAELGGALYVAGGRDRNEEIVNVVEKYDPKQDSWVTSPPLSVRRTAAGAAGLDGRLYVAGGFVPVGGNDEPTDLVVAFDPDRQEWTPLAPMPTARARLRLVALDGRLYATGGQSRQGKTLATVERYDPGLKSWATMRPMHQARGVPGVAVISHLTPRIVVVGGAQADSFDRVTGFLRSAEIYDSNRDEWTLLDAELPLPKAGLTAAIQPDGTLLAIGGSLLVDGGFQPTDEVFALDLDHHIS